MEKIEGQWTLDIHIPLPEGENGRSERRLGHMTGKQIRRLMFILECIHPALILPFLFPGFYMFLRIREDFLILPVFIAGLLILICSVICKTAVRHVRTLTLYLLACGAGIFLTVFSSRRLLLWMTGNEAGQTSLYVGSIRKVFVFVLVLECLLVAGDAFRTRMREDSRKKAIMNNDIEWAESSYLLEKPELWFLILFPLVYTGARFTACPVMCSLSLITGILYMLLVFLYAYLEGSEDSLKEVKELHLVPERKVRKTGLGIILVLLLLLFCAGSVSIFFSRFRTYHDIRQWEPKVTMTEQELQEFYTPMEEFHFPAEAFLTEEEKNAPVRPVPEWLKTVGWCVAAAVLLAILRLVFFAIRRMFTGFRDGLEENGDIVESLYEDKDEKDIAFSGKDRGSRIKNRIRRKYIRTIRKYRKTTPAPYETPEEIEEQAHFSPEIDISDLHKSYEQARYGR